MDAVLVKDTVLVSHGEGCSSKVYYLKALVQQKKSHGSQLPPTTVFRHAFDSELGNT